MLPAWNTQSGITIAFLHQILDDVHVATGINSRRHQEREQRQRQTGHSPCRENILFHHRGLGLEIRSTWKRHFQGTSELQKIVGQHAAGVNSINGSASIIMETMRDWENNFQPNRKQNPAENLPSIGNDSRKYHFHFDYPPQTSPAPVCTSAPPQTHGLIISRNLSYRSLELSSLLFPAFHSQGGTGFGSDHTPFLPVLASDSWEASFRLVECL